MPRRHRVAASTRPYPLSVALVNGLLLDIDGVLAVSWRAIPGAPEALAELRQGGVPVRFLTNTTSKTRISLAASLIGAGFDVRAEEILNATAATASFLRSEFPGARCLVVNEGDAGEDLEGIDVVTSGSADVVVLGGAGDSFSYQALNGAFRALANGAALVAMHRNLYWREADGLQLDGGAFVAALEASTGVEARVLGKPAPSFFQAGLDALGVDASSAVMVGDDVRNDVLAAQELGITGVLVRTGKFAPGDLAGLDPGPDVILGSFADVPGWLRDLE